MVNMDSMVESVRASGISLEEASVLSAVLSAVLEASSETEESSVVSASLVPPPQPVADTAIRAAASRVANTFAFFIVLLSSFYYTLNNAECHAVWSKLICTVSVYQFCKYQSVN